MPDVPLDHVRALRAQGLDNNQIIESLQRDGYSSSQIFDAINQADMLPGSPPPKAQAAQPRPASTAFFPAQEDYQDHSHEHPSFEMSNTEEIVEAIIDEKWNELLKDINRIIDWKNEAESKLVALEQKFDMLKDQFDKLHQAVVGKVGEYDKHILDVGAEIKAMEKVFSKVLPEFTENVHELQRITDKMK